MIGKRAKILSPDHVEDLLVFAQQTRNPIRNQALVLLSVKAGLRAGEIAKLTWPMLAEPNGEVGWSIEIARPHRQERQWPCYSDSSASAHGFGQATARTSRARPEQPRLRAADVKALDHAVRIIYWVCCLAGAADLLDELQGEGLAAAIRRHDTAALYDWLTVVLSYQGADSCPSRPS